MFGVRSTAFGDTSDEINRHIRNLVSQVMAGGGIPFTDSWEIYPLILDETRRAHTGTGTLLPSSTRRPSPKEFPCTSKRVPLHGRPRILQRDALEG